MLELVVGVTSADSDCIWGTMRGYLGNEIFAGPVSDGPVSLVVVKFQVVVVRVRGQ